MLVRPEPADAHRRHDEHRQHRVPRGRASEQRDQHQQQRDRDEHERVVHVRFERHPAPQGDLRRRWIAAIIGRLA